MDIREKGVRTGEAVVVVLDSTVRYQGVRLMALISQLILDQMSCAAGSGRSTWGPHDEQQIRCPGRGSPQQQAVQEVKA